MSMETERLLLRPFAEYDLNDLYDYASAPGVGETAGWLPHESIETSRDVLQSYLDKKDTFAVWHKADCRVIGSVRLHDSWTSRNDKYKHLKAKEIGCVIAKNYWGRGLATEAVNAVIAYGFSAFGLEAFGIAHIAGNSPSRRIAEKCGFTYVETGEYFSAQLQKKFDDIRYILLRDIESAGDMPREALT